MSGPEAMPAVENVALLSSAAHLSGMIWLPAVTLMVVGSIVSLKVSFIVALGSSSFPSFRGLPSAAVMAMTRGMMIVVKLHRPPPTEWCPVSVIDRDVKGQGVRSGGG